MLVSHNIGTGTADVSRVTIEGAGIFMEVYPTPQGLRLTWNSNDSSLSDVALIPVDRMSVLLVTKL